MSTRTRVAGIVAAITLTALTAACSATDGAGDSATSEVSSSGDSDGGGSGSGDSASPGAAGREVGDGAQTSPSARSAPALQMERSIIATGAISLTSEDVGKTRREVQRIVDAQGGDVTEESTESDDGGDTTYARLVVRVPSSTFSASMRALEEAGELRSSTRASDDVTTQVIDTGVRVRAQQASLERVELLLAEAKTLKDIIWIESQLTSRQAELDSLKSQQAWLEDQTSLSTITVDISAGDAGAQKPDDEPAGFLAGLERGMHAMGVMVTAVATILGALVPFAAVALVLGFPVWLVVRRRKGSRPVPAAPADA